MPKTSKVTKLGAMRQLMLGKPVPLSVEITRGSIAYTDAALSAIGILERHNDVEIRAAITIVPMRCIRYERAIDFDEPPGEHFPCAALFPAVETLLAGFLPPPAKTKSRTDSKSAWNYRLDQLMPKQIVEVASQRQLELEEAAGVAVLIAEALFDATNYVRRWTDSADDVALWHLVEELTFAIERLRKDRRGLLRYKLATGRQINLAELVAAAGVRQADIAMNHYQEGDIEAFSYLAEDINRAIVTIAECAYEDFSRARMRRHALVAHSKNPAHQAMLEIEKIFRSWQSGELRFRNDADFAAQMALRFADVKNEGSIKNACTRWRQKP